MRFDSKIVADERELLTPQEVADRLKISLATLSKWRAGRTGPKYIKCGALVRYRDASLSEWLKAAEVGQNG